MLFVGGRSNFTEVLRAKFFSIPTKAGTRRFNFFFFFIETSKIYIRKDCEIAKLGRVKKPSHSRARTKRFPKEFHYPTPCLFTSVWSAGSVS